MSRRLLLASAAALLLAAGWSAGPAAAVPVVDGSAGTVPIGPVPANDLRGGAVDIAALPFAHTEDTTSATVDAGEGTARTTCLGLGASAFEHAVWFRATVPAGLARGMTVDVTGSDFGAGVAVLQATATGLSPITCVSGLYVTAGPPPPGTYYLVVFGNGTTAATGGTLRLAADLLPDPPDVVLSIDQRATVTWDGAWISGKVTCTGGGPRTEVLGVNGKVAEHAGWRAVTGHYSILPSLPCDGVTRPWRALAPPDAGRFHLGRVETLNTAFACGIGGCTTLHIDAPVLLRPKGWYW